MRVVNWPIVLARELAAARRRPFAWDGWSCYDFCATVVAAITGVDHREKFPAYTSEAEAQALLERYGGVIGLTTHVLGESKPIALAQRGDIVVADFGADYPQPGICDGLVSFSPGPKGLVSRRTLTGVAAWSVE